MVKLLHRGKSLMGRGNLLIRNHTNVRPYSPSSSALVFPQGPNHNSYNSIPKSLALSNVSRTDSGTLMSFSDMKPNNSEYDPDDQNKRANLGSMIDEIKLNVPNIFTRSIPKHLISSNVLLRICPTHFAELNSYLPNIKGHVSYYTTCKTLQLILSSLVLNPKVKLHIQSIRTNVSSEDTDSTYHYVYPQTTKIHVRWTTCPEGCHHLSTNENIDEGKNFHSTSDAKLGSHSWSKFDTLKFLNSNNNPDIPVASDESKPFQQSLTSIKNLLSNLTTGLIGLTKEEKKLERVISGLFIFELNTDNTEIVVHTIEDVDVIERTEMEDVDGKLRIC